MNTQDTPRSEPGGVESGPSGGMSVDEWIEHHRRQPPAPRPEPATSRHPGAGRLLAIAIGLLVVAATGFLGWRWASTWDLSRDKTTKFVVGLDDLEVGDCFTAYRPPPGRRDYESGMYDVAVDRCSEPHELELVALLPIRSETFPVRREWAQLNEECRQEYASYSGTEAGSTEIEILLYAPTESDWQDRDHKAWCIAATPVDEPRSSSLRGGETS